MDNATSGKRKQRTESSPTLGTTQKKLRDNGAGGQAAGATSNACSGAEAVQVVAADEGGVDEAAVEAEHLRLEARCERPVRITVAEAVATAPAPAGVALRRRRAGVIPVHPALPFGAGGVKRRNRQWRGEGRTAVAKATSTPGRGVPGRRYM